MKYRVTWEIDVEDVDSPTDAAREAWNAMRNPDSIANVFTVTDEIGQHFTVDLDEFAAVALPITRKAE